MCLRVLFNILHEGGLSRGRLSSDPEDAAVSLEPVGESTIRPSAPLLMSVDPTESLRVSLGDSLLPVSDFEELEPVDEPPASFRFSFLSHNICHLARDFRDVSKVSFFVFLEGTPVFPIHGVD